MKVHELPADRGRRQKRKRIGRGESSGWGKTAGKGTKGQKSRSGGTKGPGFEGGQTPLYRRVPKRGFTNIFRTEYAVVNVSRLNRFEDGATVDEAQLRESGLVKRALPIKILGNGELERRLTVKAHAFSGSAREKILEKGGSCEVLE